MPKMLQCVCLLIYNMLRRLIKERFAVILIAVALLVEQLDPF